MIYQITRVECGTIVATLDCGKTAGEQAKALNENARDAGEATRYRVRAVKAEAEPTWHEREHNKLKTGWYRALPFATTRLHYAHFSDDGTKIAFTPDDLFGENDRQLTMRPGRYLERHTEYDADTRKQYCALFGEHELKFAHTPDDIERVYTNGPSSCMSYKAHTFDSPCHPVRVYGAGDLAIAYIEDEDSVTARALCFPERKIYARIYGDEHRLENLLKDAGYSDYGNWSGAKLLRIEYNGQFVAPYLDTPETGVKDHSKYLRIGGNIDCQRTDGLTEPQGEICDNCDERCNETYAVGDQSWCEYCRDNHAFYCEDCDESYSAENLSIIVNGTTICHSCSQAYTECNACSEVHVTEDMTEGLDNTRYCEGCVADMQETPCGMLTHNDDDCNCDICERHREIEDDPRPSYEPSTTVFDDPRQLDMGF